MFIIVLFTYLYALERGRKFISVEEGGIFAEVCVWGAEVSLLNV